MRHRRDIPVPFDALPPPGEPLTDLRLADVLGPVLAELAGLAQVLARTRLQVALDMRVSTEDQADRGTIDAQRDFLRQFTNLYQLPVAGEYADDGVTGTLPLEARPEGQRLLQDTEAGAFGCVLVY